MTTKKGETFGENTASLCCLLVWIISANSSSGGQKAAGVSPPQQRLGCVIQSVVCEAVVLLVTRAAGPSLRILVNHPVPTHSSFLIITCKALLAGK